MKNTLLKNIFTFLFVCAPILSLLANDPTIQKENGITRLMVDGKPFIMLSGELHNSTSSTLEYLEPMMMKMKAMNLNSVIASISWEQFEPKEGTYDYTLIDGIINQAEKYNLKVCVIWFATWKNGQSTYAPEWVEKDTQRFFRIKEKNGSNTNIISPFCERAMFADAKAFAALMKRIKEVDKNKMVIVMQPENEVGCFQDIDHGKEAQDQYKKAVPAAFLSYVKKNESTLMKELKNRWVENGKKTKGSWIEVFGDNPDSKEFFMAWQYATYIQEVVRQGKQEYTIPMYVNAWLVQFEGQLPGDYPCGGPVSKVMDVYKAAAPSIDWCSPDIYLATYKEVCAMYLRNDNPLFIPETIRDAGRVFYAFAELNAMCVAPFGIEDGASDMQLISGYKVLNELLPVIIQYQGTGKMRGYLKQKGEKGTSFTMGNYIVNINYQGNEDPSYGLVIQTGPDEFILSGMRSSVWFSATDPQQKTGIAYTWEGGYTNGTWKTLRWLNGDEASADGFGMYGRKSYYATTLTQAGELPPQPIEGMEQKAGTEVKEIIEPGIYRVKLYTIPKK